jgi:PAS domain S-box-containing protein
VIRELIGIDRDISRLVAAQDIRDVPVLEKRLMASLETIESALGILQHGGTFIDRLPANINEQDEIEEKYSYWKPRDKDYIIEVIDLTPKIVDIKELSVEFFPVIRDRLGSPSEERNPGDHSNVVLLYKQLNTFLQRSRENATKIFHDSSRQIQRLQQIKQRAVFIVSMVRHGVRLVVFIVGAMIFAFVYGQIGRIIEGRRKAEQELARHRDHLEDLVKERTAELDQIFNTAADGMQVIDRQYHVLRVNDTLATLTGRKKEDMIGRKCYEILNNSLCHTNECPLKKIVDEKTPRVQIFGTKKQRADGTEFVCIVTATPFLGPRGETVGIVEDISDISELKQTEAELQTTQEKLIETAHKAGMAEVASGVLHNVGNVLNSINISTSILKEKMSSSKIQNLNKVVQMISEHRGDLGTFLTTDERGKHIPTYLTEVAKVILDEQTIVVERLQSLARNVEHIKQIITAQQGYARMGGTEVVTNINEIIEDAVEINSASMEKYGLNLKLEYAELPEIRLDRQRILQILVNLIGNSKEALLEVDREDKWLNIRSYQSHEDRLRVEVRDNGIGISKDNITKIFQHGFTTKERGHGFGLHSSASAAREMGGALTVYSEGLGHGATFTLELPLNKSEALADGCSNE